MQATSSSKSGSIKSSKTVSTSVSIKSVLKSHGYTYKGEFVKSIQWIVEAIDCYGSSVAIITETFKTTKTKVPANILSLSNADIDHLTGVLVYTPSSFYVRRGTQYFYTELDELDNKSIRVLPVISIEEIKTDLESTNKLLDNAVSHTTKKILINTTEGIENFDKIHADYVTNSRDMFLSQDALLRKTILSTRELRDQLLEAIEQKDNDSMSRLKLEINRNQHITDEIHTQVESLNHHMRIVSDLVLKTKERNEELHSEYQSRGV